MISYFQAARELDARWTGSLQFLPPTPCLRSARDCLVVRQIASTEIDLFNRYAKEITVANRLKFGLLVELYDMLLSTGLIFADELGEVRMPERGPPRKVATRRRQAPERADRSSSSIGRTSNGNGPPSPRTSETNHPVEVQHHRGRS